MDGKPSLASCISPSAIRPDKLSHYYGDDSAPAAKGIEVYATVWYEDASEDGHLEAERRHMIIEEIVWRSIAKKTSTAESWLSPRSSVRARRLGVFFFACLGGASFYPFLNGRARPGG